MKTDPGYALVIQVLATANVMVRESHRLFRPHGLSEAQFNVLNIVADRPAGISQRELSDLLVVDRSNITGLLDRMEKLGWVRRTDHPSDRRVYLVALTGEGRKLWQKVLPEYTRAVNEVTSALPPAELRRALDVMQRLERAARQWAERA